MASLLGKISSLPDDALLGVDRLPEALKAVVEPFDRDVRLDTLTAVINQNYKLFGDDPVGKALTKSDSWLAPRVHASLRLTKREASDSRIWTFLAAYAFPDYVVWRWGRERQRALATTRDVRKHPFKR